MNGVKENWDNFDNFDHYDDFTMNWLKSCRKILKSNGSMWVIGSTIIFLELVIYFRT